MAKKLKKGQCRIWTTRAWGGGWCYYVMLWTGGTYDDPDHHYKKSKGAIRAARRLARELGLEVVE